MNQLYPGYTKFLIWIVSAVMKGSDHLYLYHTHLHWIYYEVSFKKWYPKFAFLARQNFKANFWHFFEYKWS